MTSLQTARLIEWCKSALSRCLLVLLAAPLLILVGIAWVLASLLATAWLVVRPHRAPERVQQANQAKASSDDVPSANGPPSL